MWRRKDWAGRAQQIIQYRAPAYIICITILPTTTQYSTKCIYIASVILLTRSPAHSHAAAVRVKVCAPAEVGQDEVAVVAQQQVLWLYSKQALWSGYYIGVVIAEVYMWYMRFAEHHLNVSVHDIPLVQIGQRVQQLSEILSRQPLREPFHPL